MTLKDRLCSCWNQNLERIMARLVWLDAYVKPWLQRPVKYGIIATALFFFISLLRPNYYTSMAVILPAEAKTSGLGGLGSAAAAATALGISIPGQDSSDAAYIDILKSRPVREALLNAPYKFSYPGLGRIQFTLGPVSTIRKYEGSLFAFIEEPNLDDAVQATEDFISISRDLKTKVLTIKVETRSPELSQQIAQNLVKFLNDFILNKSQTKGSVKAQFAEKRLIEGRMEMDKAEEEFRAFIAVNRNYMFSTDPSIKLKGLRLENELKLRTQLVTTLAISREDALLQEKNDMSILNVLDAGNLPINKSRPGRTTNAILFGVLIVLGSLAWDFRQKIKDLIAASLSDAT